MNGTPGSPAPTGTGPLVPLGATGWSLWSEAALRGAGFPAARFTEICDGELAAAADLSTGDRADAQQRYADAYTAATERLSAAVRRLAADDRFREAVAWQNPELVRTCLDKAAAGEPRNVRGRNHELTIVSHLQRYTLKNDSIGFFGPIGWASVRPTGDGLEVINGPSQLARRSTYFERWAIAAVAGAIAARPEVWPWLRPRTAPSASLTGWVARLPFHKPVTLTAREAALLRQCTGEHTVRDIAGYPPDPQTMGTLLRLRELGLVELGFVDRRTAWPERELAAWIDTVPDAGVRARAHAPLADLVGLRDRVSSAAGDPDRLLRTVEALARRFEEFTGGPSTRLAGATYAGRTLVYEDTVRATDVRLGRTVTEAIAEPLGVLLGSARWLANTIAERYRDRALRLFEREVARSGSDTVPFLGLFTAVLSEMATPGAGAFESEAVHEVVEDLRRRWREVLALTPGEALRTRRHHVRAEEIAERAERLFATGAPLFSCAKWHSPDLMVLAPRPGAPDPDGLRFVLGELHCASNTLEALLFAAQHPEPDRLRDAAAASGLDDRVFLIPRTDSHQASTRMARSAEVLLPGYTYLCLGDESQTPPEGAVVHSVLDLTVERRGDGLVVRHRPSGRSYDFLEVVGEPLSTLCAGAFRPFGGTGHTPRISIDRLVVSRESWTLPVATADWAFVKDERRRYAQARRWRAAHGLPERCFYRVPVERKPLAVDFRSLALVNLLAKAVRRTVEAGHPDLGISEMLPDLDQLWLHDADGGPYTSELRLVAVESGPPPSSTPDRAREAP
ncbi:lantibiotic dehydratase [Kitasatospora sp. NPDC127059]|uniref:lantibiotic dehydratase n=1 Tax=unclassified Kitasatospora TaxID=2633591 RepID=UPI0036516B50